MPGRALLVGAQTFELTGVDYDVRAVGAMLDERGFEDVRVCEGSDATRDGIIDAYERVIADTTADDAVVVYYSGHGGLAEPLPGGAVEVARTDRQFIVPTDFEATIDGDFRGILAIELSVLLERLTARTDNAVVVLDCCHSAMMSRDLGNLRPRQLPMTSRVDLDAHLRRQVAAGLRVDLARPRGNEHAVRLVACATDQFAYEQRVDTASGARGLLTDALLTALREASGVRVSWSRLMARVRYLVGMHTRHQRPDVEGPFERVLFETIPDDTPGSLPVTAEGIGRARLDGAGLLGVQVGDEFAITAGREGDPTIATLQVDRRRAVVASGPLQFPGRPVPLGATVRAHRTKAVAPRVPVRLPAVRELVAAVDRCMFVRPAEPGEDAPFQLVVAAGGQVSIHDRIGPLHPPRLLAPDTIVRSLERVGRATAVLSLREERGGPFEAPFTAEWGRVVDGRPRRLPADGASVEVGTPVYVEVRNTGSTPLYLSLLDVGVSYGITVLTDSAASGVVLPPTGTYVYGGEDGLEGMELTWPEGLDPRARPETVLVLLTEEPHDMSVMEQHGVHKSLGGRSALTDLLAHLGGGATRDLRPRKRERDLFCVRSFEFTLVPHPRGVGAT